jgi:ubiquinone/menaquinone biosynthesis C-methylase UbiE
MAFSDPQQVIQQAGLQDGAIVADFGAGSGHYSIAAGKIVGSNGRVYAIDIQKELLARLQREAQGQGVGNIEVVWGDIESPQGSKLTQGSVDLVMIANVLFQIERRAVVVAEAQRVLRPGGKLLLVDWRESFGGIGPKPADVIPPTLAKELAVKAGFTFERELSDAGEHHYGLVFKNI